jgi:hypothetical protein
MEGSDSDSEATIKKYLLWGEVDPTFRSTWRSRNPLNSKFTTVWHQIASRPRVDSNCKGVQFLGFGSVLSHTSSALGCGLLSFSLAVLFPNSDSNYQSAHSSNYGSTNALSCNKRPFIMDKRLRMLIRTMYPPPPHKRTLSDYIDLPTPSNAI